MKKYTIKDFDRDFPDDDASLDEGTLAAILGPKQTCIGKAGLLVLVNKHGV